MRAADPESKEISGQQEIDDLSPPVAANRKTPRRPRDAPVPALHVTLLRVDLLVSLIPRLDSERLQCLRYRSRDRDTIVHPHRFTDIQASTIGVHFSSSIVCLVAVCLCFIGDPKHLDDGRTEVIFGKITQRTTT